MAEKSPGSPGSGILISNYKTENYDLRLSRTKTASQWSFLFLCLKPISQTLQSGENLTVRNEWAAAAEDSLEGFHCCRAVPDICCSSLLRVGTPSSDSSFITPAQTRPSWVHFGGARPHLLNEEVSL